MDDRKICRLCLGDGAHYNLFQEDSKVVSKIQICCMLEVQASDGLPDHICSECVKILDIAANFRIQCQENDKILRNNLHLHNSWQSISKKSDISDDLKEECDPYNDVDNFMSPQSSDEDYKSNVHDGDGGEPPLDAHAHKTRSKKRKKSKKLKRDVKEKIKKNKKTKTHLEKIIKIKKEKTPFDNSCLCTICGQVFSKRSAFHSHLRVHKKESFLCNECMKSFNCKRNLVEHLNTHFGVKNIPCSICGRLFLTRSHAVKHLNRVHKRLSVVKCNVCFKDLADNATLKNHMKSHTGEMEFECEICKRPFTFKSSLKLHMRTHTGEKPYSCKFCGKRYAALKTLIDHEMLHTGETPYSCPVCFKGFAQLSNMKSHFKYNHKDDLLSNYPSYKKRHRDRLKNEAENGTSISNLYENDKTASPPIGVVTESVNQNRNIPHNIMDDRKPGDNNLSVNGYINSTMRLPMPIESSHGHYS